MKPVSRPELAHPVFGEELRERAAQKYHLTAFQAGEPARRAGVKFAVPFHCSPIYHGREAEFRRQFDRAFRGWRGFLDVPSEHATNGDRNLR